MTWLVEVALRRPYTFVVMALLMMLMGGLAIQGTPKDVLPSINIPVVAIIWSYSGMPAGEIEKRIVNVTERALTTTVDNIEHMESQSFLGTAVVKVFLQPNGDLPTAIAEINAECQTLVHALPAGIAPPLILRYNASSVPILQLAVSSKTLPEQDLYDFSANFIRGPLAAVPGASIPVPSGGKPPAMVVDLDPQALLGKQITPVDVSNALAAQNLILPTGTAKIGDREYSIAINSSPSNVSEFDRLPVRETQGATVFLGDVAHVHNGYSPQTNIVREDGRRSALLSVLKNGSASTLDVVAGVKSRLPKILATLPPELEVSQLFDQSTFVSESIFEVVREAVIAACLTAFMILIFLGSWRSTVIVAVSIPCAIFASIILLSWSGATLNIMTLGGLALAVGILVDDATVELENIDRNLHSGVRPLREAILLGASQIAVPTLVSTMCICVVFVSVLFLTGPAKFLFTPMALSVVFAMTASYLLSRTLVPTMVQGLLGAEVDQPRSGPIWKLHLAFERRFERLVEAYRGRLEWVLKNARVIGIGAGLFCLLSLAMVPLIGQDFFPTVDAGQIRMHVRVPAGTRVETTEQYFVQVENCVRQLLAARESVRAASADVLTALQSVQVASASARAGRMSLSASQSDGQATRASLQAQSALQGYERVVAPFDGIITGRFVDEGALIKADTAANLTTSSASSTSTALFGIARLEAMRVMLAVPQSSSTQIRAGEPISIAVRELPNQKFPGKIARVSGALDPQTRTRQVEVRIPNPTGRLIPGMYASARLENVPSTGALRLPSTAVIIDAQGSRVAVVAQGQKIHWQGVTLGTDYGTSIEIAGVTAQDRCVDNPPEGIREGDVVETKSP